MAYDPDHVEALLQAAARAGEAMTYSEVLEALGDRFSRPKMRALCRTLEEVDARARGRNEPELAVLVVRASDRLPGQGWWVALAASGGDYRGGWTGLDADRLIRTLHRRVFAFWKGH